jgi:hypothetical protein
MKQFTFSSYNRNEMHTNFKITPETISIIESVEGVKKATPLDDISCYVAIIDFEKGADVPKIISDIADKILDDDNVPALKADLIFQTAGLTPVMLNAIQNIKGVALATAVGSMLYIDFEPLTLEAEQVSISLKITDILIQYEK